MNGPTILNEPPRRSHVRCEVRCPCCGAPVGDSCCLTCGHRWQPGATNITTIDYARKTGRNALPRRYVEHKLADRLAALTPRVRPGMRMLEVGCAEGELGARLKTLAAITYWGIEPSMDSAVARCQLDAVFPDSRALPANASAFDAILSFHVLEHIPAPLEELARWRALLRADGWMMLEVPCRAGHPDVDADRNTEHLHHFTPASLACLLEKSGFDLVALSRGHFESPVYSDSLRVTVVPRPTPEARRMRLLAQFATLPAPFAIHGIGGDFRSYVLPLLAQLPVAALIDATPREPDASTGQRPVEAYTPECHAALPILVCSLRHEESILVDLQRVGHAAERIHLLADIYNPEAARA